MHRSIFILLTARITRAIECKSFQRHDTQHVLVEKCEHPFESVFPHIGHACMHACTEHYYNIRLMRLQKKYLLHRSAAHIIKYAYETYSDSMHQRNHHML